MDSRSIAEPGWFVGLTLVIPAFFMFTWYWMDSASRSFRRSPLLNAAMVAFAVVTVPFYLYRSRAKGERGAALLQFLGFALLYVAASVVGAVITYWVA